jgi:hypothetical protein
MKFKAHSFSFLLSRLIVNTCLLTISGTSVYTFAAQEAKPERWFEIEVILFEQLNDKRSLKEQFSNEVGAKSLPQYKRSIDLLNPYLQPNLTAIKQLMPLCSNIDGQSRFSLTQKKLVFALPDQAHFIQQANAFTYEPIALELSEVETVNTEEDDTQPLENHLKAKLENTIKNNTEQSFQDEILTEHSTNPTSSALIFDWQTESLNSSLFSTNQLCVYSQEDFEHILEKQQLANFTLDGFAVTAMGKKLNASGVHIKSQPYLIADNSLLLKDISKRLRWSKEFKPLLHFGWRQVGVTRTKATPLKLFAGQHVENDYQQALNDYQIRLKEAQQAEQLLFEQLQESDAGPATDDAALNEENQQSGANYYAQVKQQALAQLFSDIDTLEVASSDATSQQSSSSENSIIDETISQLTAQNLDDLLASNEIIHRASEQALDIISPPIEPLQPWFLDGFFKVHLDHYLYITADFNLLSKKEQDKQFIDSDSKETKLVNFSQNRRVITGEIHYFDHPYIGMVVQIRRFDPSKPADEAVTQAIK